MSELKEIDRRAEERRLVEGEDYRFYCQSSLNMEQCADSSISLTVTSPPYWNSIDYDIHARNGAEAWHRERSYQAFGETFKDYLANIAKVFQEVYLKTKEGGFCAIVVGTILHKGKHYPAPMMITQQVMDINWEFHQDIVWNKVTGGVKRAGSFIQHTKSGYYYPNIMTEYILIFRKPGLLRRGRKKSLDIDDLFTRDIANNVWHIAPVPPNTINHPCPFPEELARRLVLLYSEEGDEILDPFLGSGQTALAAIKHKRKCVGYDIEESYLNLARKRIRSPPLSRKFNLMNNFNLIVRFDRVATGYTEKESKRPAQERVMTKYRAERRIFDRLRDDCSIESRQAYELAIKTLIERYNSTIYENRFIVGGAVEVFTFALLRSVGIDCTLYSEQEMGGDILLPRNRKLSIKSSFVGVRRGNRGFVGVQSVRLLNKMGEGVRPWTTATFFVVAGVGIVFGAPDMVNPSHLEPTGDALELKAAGLRSLLNNSDNIMAMDIAQKSPTEMTGFSHKASVTIARGILFEMKLTPLLRAFSSAERRRGT